MDWAEKRRQLMDQHPPANDWLESMNHSVAYIEENLAGTIEVDLAARIACCSAYYYQRIFSWLAGRPLADYIRRRRLTLAAFDLQRDARVIDVALRYGYETPDSFSRAFKGLHGILPSAVRRDGAVLQASPPLAFHIAVRGDVVMQYQMQQMKRRALFGVSIPVNTGAGEQTTAVPAFWQRVREDGTGQRIRRVAGLEASAPLHGAIYDCTEEGYQYLIGAFPSDAPVPDEFTVLEVPAGTWAVFPPPATTMRSLSQQSQQLWNCIFTEWFATSGYELRPAPELELHFAAGQDLYRAEIWIPVEG